jgi:hypothetical protein
MTPPATATAPRLAPGTRRRAQTRPRRVSGPAPSARATEPRGIALRVIDTVEGISSSSLLDRLIRGRLWIGLLAFALIGIVAMQLLVLELNTGIGRKLARVAQLQIANSQLGIEDSGASAEARIDPLASASGMTFAPSGSVHFVAASPVDVGRAAVALSTVIKAPTAVSSEPAPTIESGEPSSSSQVAEAPTSGSEASSSTTPSTATESGSSEVSSQAGETLASASGQTASSASASEVSSRSPESGAAASPTGAGGGVQAGLGE